MRQFNIAFQPRLRPRRSSAARSSRMANVGTATIGRGIKDLREPGSLAGKVRRKGAGRPAITIPRLIEVSVEIP
jgi:hypothetical protein